MLDKAAERLNIEWFLMLVIYEYPKNRVLQTNIALNLAIVPILMFLFWVQRKVHLRDLLLKWSSLMINQIR